MVTSCPYRLKVQAAQNRHMVTFILPESSGPDVREELIGKTFNVHFDPFREQLNGWALLTAKQVRAFKAWWRRHVKRLGAR